MSRLVFDLEADGLLDTISVVHCIVTKDADTAEVRHFRPEEIEAGLEHLCSATQLIAQNGINYDLHAIRHLYPAYYTRLRAIDTIDTLVLARVVWPEIKQTDFKRQREGRLPGKFIGAHKLEAWGYRLGLLKGEYGKKADAWAEFTEEMLEYCELDVEITDRLLKAIEKKDLDPRCAQLEHATAWVLAAQMQTGYPFNEPAAQDLYAKLAAEREEARFAASEAIRPWYVPVRKHGELVTQTPKRSDKRYGYVKDMPFCPVKLMEFNPGSDQQVADRLSKLCGWEPVEFTENGQASCTEEVLAPLPYPEAKAIGRYRMLDKRCSQLAEGDAAWLKKVQADGRIYGYINQNGAVTGRGTHSHPNLGQVPANDKEYGAECRELFYTPEVIDGRRMVQLGTDMSGLELRCLGHYMARYDSGEYIDLVLHGDVHTANQEAAGLPTRNQAKTFCYAWLYGAGAGKIGKIIGKGPREGKVLIDRFLKRTPALSQLKQRVAEAAARGWLKGLDGRRIPIRSPHSALNTLLQSAGAILCKQWMVTFHELMQDSGYVLGHDYHQFVWVHDELQLCVREEIADHAGQLSNLAAARAGESFQFRCPLAADYKTGRNWRECH